VSCHCSDDHNSSKVIDAEKQSNLRAHVRPSYLIYGLADSKFTQRQTIGKKYNFFYQSVGNCEITDSLRNVIKNHNKFTDSLLSSKWGEDWNKRFDFSVDSLYALDSNAIFIVDSDPYIRNFKLIKERKNTAPHFYPNLEYKVFPTPKRNIRLITVEGYGAINEEIVTLNYLRVTIDMEKKSILNIDSTEYQNR